MSDLWLLPIGALVGAFGTLIGAGGGFLLVPLLLLLYPHEPADTITSISLAVVFFNAFSGSIAYGRMKRIDYYSGLRFSAAAVPGAILGAALVSYVPRRAFDSIFGVFLLLAGSWLLFLKPPTQQQSPTAVPGSGRVVRSVTEADGTHHVFAYNPVIGMVLSALVGFVSSLLGIGGGIIHVPALVYLLGFPAHIATATSHFILAVMAFSGSIVHVVNGAFANNVLRTVSLGAGALVGAQVGARLSNKVHAKWILRSLALGVIFVGIRILLLAL
jgi:uncharacterized membrane protein YfcA